MTTVHIVFGEQGAGKTTYAHKLANQEKAVCFSIDDWMATLYEADLPKPLDFAWIMERVQRCEHLIWLTAVDIAHNGGNVILDLGFMKQQDRTRFIYLAQEQQLLVRTHFVTAPHDLRRNRVLLRNKSKTDTFSFEVTPEMFDFMEHQFEPPTNTELSNSIVIRSK